MSKSSKSKKNKVPVIGDKEYTEYINYLKTGSDGMESSEKTTAFENRDSKLKNEIEMQKK
jgi:hypothetical protein